MEQDHQVVEEEDVVVDLDKVQVVIVYVQIVDIESHINLVYPVIQENVLNVEHL